MRNRTTLLAMLVATGASAQDRRGPAGALAAKLASPFLQRADWVTDYDAALRAAKKRKTLIFGYFTTANY